jgi:hypothetical protein
MSRYVVLDLDNCLIYSRQICRSDITCDPVLPRDDFFYMTQLCTNSIGLIRKRKNLDFFIRELIARGYVLIVWSAAEPSYVKTICNVLFGRNKLAHVLTRTDLPPNERKNFTVIKRYIPNLDISKTILIDDRLDNGADFPNNFIQVPVFEGQHDDALLIALNHIDEWFNNK